MTLSRLFLGLTFLIALAVGALAVFQPIRIGGATLSLGWGSEASAVLEQFALPPDVTDPPEITVDGPDGPMPEIARRSFTTAVPGPVLAESMTLQCTAMGFEVPSDDLKRMEPDTLCARRDSGKRTTVLLSTTCETTRCDATLQVHVLSF